MPLRKLLPFVAVAITLAACSADTLTGPARTATTRTPSAHYETDESGGIGTLGGGGRAP